VCVCVGGGGVRNKLTFWPTCVSAGNLIMYSLTSQPVSRQRVSVQMILLHFEFKLIAHPLQYEVRTNYHTTLQKYGYNISQGVK
jgi:hypothetical protein